VHGKVMGGKQKTSIFMNTEGEEKRAEKENKEQK
jgi:hypothetical protein